MPFDATLSLRAENLPDTDTFGKIDPYYEVWFKDEMLYKSECHKNADSIVEWAPATFQVPTLAFMRELNVKMYDKDTFTKDDLILEVEIRYPFRMKTYDLGETGAKLAVLNDDGESADDESDGSLVEDGDGGFIKKSAKLAAGYFALKKLGSMW